MSQKILITGASGGFGKLILNKLIQDGHTVSATMRDVAGRNKAIAADLSTAGATVIEMDITNDASVASAVAQANTEMQGIDVLINNAGIGNIGMQEFYTTADFTKIFDVNVFGVQRMVREVAPLMRANGKGLIMYTSSLLGRICMPFYGPYQSSKWALEAMAENYRVELSAFGIENVIVEPGGYPTTFMENLVKPSDSSRVAAYGGYAHAPEGMLNNFENVLKQNPQQDPNKVAEAFANIIAMPYGEKPFRNPVDFIGMGDLVSKYNDHLEQILTGLYTNFGTQGMLSVKK